MSDLLNRFKICSKISEEVKQKIKIFHVFEDFYGYNVLFVTNDDKVFAFGRNTYGCCGFGHNRVVNKPQVIPELYHKNIKQFFIGKTFILALSNDKKRLYGWGKNSFGQLGRGFKSGFYEYLKPEVIELPSNEKVIEVSTGSHHSLALTTEGRVFGWGDNEHGQIGCGKHKGESICRPIWLEKFNYWEFKSIHCSGDKSFALTTDGLVYSWGQNCLSTLGHDLEKNECVFEPRLIILGDCVRGICLASENTYFLTKYGDIYLCGSFKNNNKRLFQRTPKLLEKLTLFNYLNSISIYQKSVPNACAVSDEHVYRLLGNSMKKLKYKTLFDYYCDEYKVCYKTISIDRRFDERIERKISRDFHKFSDDFKILETIGSGAFGTVFKVENNYNNLKYAIKKIICDQGISVEEKNDLLREVETLYKCNDEYVVHCFDHWIEDNNCLYIRMELCSDNLQNIIQKKSEYFNRKGDEMMSVKEYFISCQLFQEVLECVKYLHESNPPIIHRDLKPENILVNEKPYNGRHLKLGDFGSAKPISFNTNSGNTRGEGTQNYIAPEVANGTKYSTKADIYSLGKISLAIFDFNHISSNKLIVESLSNKWMNLEKTIESMTSVIHQKRPTCAQILNSNEWSFKRREINKLKLDQFENNEDCFFTNYLQTRLSMFKFKRSESLISRLSNIF